MTKFETNLDEKSYFTVSNRRWLSLLQSRRKFSKFEFRVFQFALNLGFEFRVSNLSCHILKKFSDNLPWSSPQHQPGKSESGGAATPAERGRQRLRRRH